MPTPTDDPAALVQSPSFAQRFIITPVRGLLDGIWHLLAYIVGAVIVGGILVNVTISLLTTGTPGITDPRTWVVTHPLLAQPTNGAIGLGIAGLVMIAAFLGHRASHKVKRSIDPELVRDYGVASVQGAVPSPSLIPSYKHPYRPRRTKDTHADADDMARKALHDAATRADPKSPGGTYGICVYGRKMLGTSRLAWQAMKHEHELSKWMLVQWPLNPQRYGEFIQDLRGMNIVLWLENLSQYVNTSRYTAINDLPSLLQDAKIPFVVIATCQDGADERIAGKAFASLIDHLTPIRLADLSRDDALKLVVELSREGERASLDDQFDGTPGSIVLAVTRMRDVAYPGLPNDAKLILRTMKLLRSAGIRTYTLPRVLTTARDLFEPTRSEWGHALDALAQAEFLRPNEVDANGLVTIAPVTDVYLDVAVPEYRGSGASAVAEWPRLQESLERARDGQGLARLGDTFRRHDDNAHAEACYRSVLTYMTKETAKEDWALAQLGLGSVLAERIEETAEGQRAALLAEAREAFVNTLSIVTQESDPTTWAEASSGLAAVAWAEASSGLPALLRQRPPTTGQVNKRIRLLDTALAECRDALKILKKDNAPDEWAGAEYKLGLVLSTYAQLTWDTRGRNGKLDAAIEAHKRALTMFAKDGYPIKVARVERALGDACRLRADTSRQPRKGELLQQAVESYNHALGISMARLVWPQDEAAVMQSYLGYCLRALAALSEAPRRVELLVAATDAFRAAAQGLEHQTPPILQAEALRDLGFVLRDQAVSTDKDSRLALVDQAITALGEALRSLGRFGSKDLHAEIHLGLAGLYWQRVLDAVAPTCSDILQVKENADRAQHIFTEGSHPTEHGRADKLFRDAERKARELGCVPTTVAAGKGDSSARNRREG